MTELSTLKRRAAYARTQGITCSASRHLHEVALRMADGKPAHDLPQDVAASLLAVLEALWIARAELKKGETP